MMFEEHSRPFTARPALSCRALAASVPRRRALQWHPAGLEPFRFEGDRRLAALSRPTRRGPRYSRRVTERDYDVVVIGSGAAGLAAAIRAADGGARVIVLEADTRVGGSSRLSGGHFYAAGTSVQREAKIEDSADAMFDHYMTLNQFLVEPAIVRRYCDLSAPTLEWLKGLGVVYPADQLYASGVGRVPRGHVPQGEGLAVIQTLDRERAARGIDVALDTRADRLLHDPAVGVDGVEAGGEAVRCGAVIVATGGFGANPERLAKHYPDALEAGDWTWYIGSPLVRGDGLALGEEVGAALDGHNRGLLLLTPGFSRDLEIVIPGWVVLVDRGGRRFTDETAHYTMLAGLVKHHGGVAFAIFDEETRRAAEPTPWNRAYWVNDVLQAKAEEGRIQRAESIDALARAAGIDAQALAGTIDRYNADVARGTDTAFFKRAEGMRPIVTPPFYAVEVRPGILCWTGAGLRIDADTRVLGHDERPIPGLYAAGETVGSLHGDRYIGGGGSFGPCLVFGALAGEHAARFAAGEDAAGA